MSPPLLDRVPVHGAIRAKAPLRISFAGGGTDVQPFPRNEGGLVLNATIDRYAYGSLRSRPGGQICVESVDYGMSVDFGAREHIPLDGKLDLVKAVIRKFGGVEEAGYDLLLHSNAPPGSGLGSSSAVMVCLIGLLNERYNMRLTPYEVAHLAFMVEREDLGICGGAQDQYAAAFGGFNFIEFDGDAVIVNPLRIDPSTVDELEHNLILAYTGITRASSQIIEDQSSRLVSGVSDTVDGLRAQKELALEMKSALLRNRCAHFAELLGQAWAEKKRLSPKITNPLIDEIYEVALRAGAIGGKVTGAGGGGYLLLYSAFDKKHRVQEALAAMGVAMEEFGFAPRGMVSWHAEN